MSWSGFIIILLLMAIGGGCLVAIFKLGHIILGCSKEEFNKMMPKNLKEVLIRLIIMIIFIGAVVLFGFGIKKILPESLGLQPTTVLFLLMVMFSWFASIRIYWRTKQAGNILLNLGRSKLKKFEIIGGVAMLLTGIYSLIDNTIMNAPEINGILYSICFLSLGMLTLFVPLRGWKIREKGITGGWSFIPWEKIESYEWGQDKEHVLSLRLKWRESLLKIIKAPELPMIRVPVPPDKKEEVIYVLKMKLPDIN